jgi:hypothetical protein
MRAVGGVEVRGFATKPNERKHGGSAEYVMGQVSDAASAAGYTHISKMARGKLAGKGEGAMKAEQLGVLILHVTDTEATGGATVAVIAEDGTVFTPQAVEYEPESGTVWLKVSER